MTPGHRVGRPRLDRLAEDVVRMPHPPGDVLHRALVAIAVTHQLAANGHCRTCARRRWPRRRRARAGCPPAGALAAPGDCHTRQILRATLRDAAPSAPPSPTSTRR